MRLRQLWINGDCLFKSGLRFAVLFGRQTELAKHKPCVYLAGVDTDNLPVSRDGVLIVLEGKLRIGQVHPGNYIARSLCHHFPATALGLFIILEHAVDTTQHHPRLKVVSVNAGCLLQMDPGGVHVALLPIQVGKAIVRLCKIRLD